ncbi:MAG: hypothetical protein IKY78_10560 [Clostridia bacterium]|nr:hypothetical protein [Clostridia bacterium]
MNVIECVRNTVSRFDKISKICDAVHVDFTDAEATSYGLSPTGDALINENILGDQIRQHTFILYAVYQSLNDYDRLSNSGVLLELQQWLEKQQDAELSVEIDGKTHKGKLNKLIPSNGMIYSIPDENLNENVRYQLQITAEYTIFNEEV